MAKKDWAADRKAQKDREADQAKQAAWNKKQEQHNSRTKNSGPWAPMGPMDPIPNPNLSDQFDDLIPGPYPGGSCGAFVLWARHCYLSPLAGSVSSVRSELVRYPLPVRPVRFVQFVQFAIIQFVQFVQFATIQ